MYNTIAHRTIKDWNIYRKFSTATGSCSHNTIPSWTCMRPLKKNHRSRGVKQSSIRSQVRRCSPKSSQNNWSSHRIVTSSESDLPVSALGIQRRCDYAGLSVSKWLPSSPSNLSSLASLACQADFSSASSDCRLRLYPVISFDFTRLYPVDFVPIGCDIIHTVPYCFADPSQGNLDSNGGFEGKNKRRLVSTSYSLNLNQVYLRSLVWQCTCELPWSGSVMKWNLRSKNIRGTDHYL